MTMQRQTGPDGGMRTGPRIGSPFRRMLVVTDESPSADAAVRLVAEWVGGPGAEVHFVQVVEGHRSGGRDPGTAADASGPAHQLVIAGATLGARNRHLVHGVARAAEEFGADVIVFGFDRSRLAGHRLTRSLREQIMRATDLPVLVAPDPAPAGKHHRLLAALHHEERADVRRGGQVRV